MIELPAAPDGEPSGATPRRRLSGSARTITVLAVVAVVFLAAGLVLGRLIVSPSEAASRAAPPEAGPISVPVEHRELANDVVLRGDVVYEDPVAVVVETGDLGGPAIVTGGVPAVGDSIEAGTVVLEVTGRPVIALSGDLPVYRTLRAGVSGPDVLQLKTALAGLGLFSGDTADPVYDAAAASGVTALYDRVGYPAPTAGEDVELGVTAAREGVDQAEEGLRLAQAELASASDGAAAGPERVRLDAAVRTAEAVLAEVRAACDQAPATCIRSEVTAAEGSLATAVAERDLADRAPDTTSQAAAVTAAQRALDRARTDLRTAQTQAMTPLPAGEVVYLAAMPRRVDAVNVARGATVSGTPAMSVSGATLQIRGTVPTADAELISAGTAAVVVLPDDTEVAATVASVGAERPEGDAEDTAGRTEVIITPTDLTEQQRTALQGTNVRVVIPVGSTGGEVLAVPLAALTAGPGGEARVEVLDGDTTTLLEVRTGLAADGFVEVTAVDGTLSEGDRVVVGRTGGETSETGSTAGEEPASTDGEETAG